jgi:hypothetical protein
LAYKSHLVGQIWKFNLKMMTLVMTQAMEMQSA